jgi:hypothetical protein
VARRADGPVIHFAGRQDADERIHMGPALCHAGVAQRTEGEQYVSGDWAYVTCKRCLRQLAAVNAREAREAVDEWDAPSCLRWLAAHTAPPHHYALRAADWAGEVARYAAYEQVDPAVWEAEATEELRAAVRAAWTAATLMTRSDR